MTVAVIGGGASGLMAAITAARLGSGVIILERQGRVGKKLLATGNGRCNLSNRNLTLEHYHGETPEFAGFALSAFDTGATLDFFAGLGLITVTEPSGRVYPLSDHAGSVVDVLRFAAVAAGAELKTDFEVCEIRRLGRGFLVRSENESIACDKVIVCCGGMAGGRLGGGKSGFELLKALGHSLTGLYPSLVQIKTDNSYVKALKGIRADAELRLMRGEELLALSAGELQFTEYGVSGPAAFEISRAAAAKKGALRLHIDLMRPMTREQLESVILQRIKVMPALLTDDLLTGMLQNRLGRTIIRYAGYELGAPITSLASSDISSIAAAVKNFSLPVIDTLGFDSAQVTAGGVKTSEFDPETMESRLVPGLYAAGEVLDIDGDCGGYNLQWAWASGHLAGQTL